MLVLRLLAFCLKKVAAVDDVVKQSCQIYFVLFLSADSFSSALLVVSSKGEGEGGEGELFDKFFVAFVFQLKPGILALNQVVSLETITWTQN